MDEEILGQVKKFAVIGAFFGVALLFYFLQWRGALRAYVVLVGFCATLAILIQSGKGGGLSATFGGLGGEGLLGVRSATPIAKATYVMLGLFLVICMLAARLGPGIRDKGPGLLNLQAPAPAAKAPAVPSAGQPAKPAEGAPSGGQAPGATSPAAPAPAAPAPAAPAAQTPPATTPATPPGGAPQP